MKKLSQIFLIPALILTFFPGTVFAASTFEAANLPDSLFATVGENFKTSFNFFYSGTGQGLRASIANSNVPDGIFLGSIERGSATNSYSVAYSGVPKKAGDFHLTLMFSDDSGTVFTKNFNMSVSGFNFREEPFLNPLVNEPYSANIHFNYLGSSRPSIRFYDVPDSFSLSYPNVYGENGIFLLQFIPQKTGTFTLKGDVTINSIVVITGKVFTFNVVKPSAYAPQGGPAPKPKTTITPSKTGTSGQVKNISSGNIATSSSASSSAEFPATSEESEGFLIRLWHWFLGLFK